MKTYKSKISKITAIYLIELIMSMIIISISFTSVIMATYVINKVPSKKYIKQATQIASNYLNEILGKDFPTTIPCPNIIDSSSSSRTNYTNICQYNNLINDGAKDIAGEPISGLENFTVNVKIITSDQAVLDNLSGGSNVDEAKIIRIDVNVSRENMENILLSTYKNKYL
jgi:hypothetical protein